MSALCQRCALCCDGELFATVPLAPAEARALRKLVVLPATDVLPQPCVALRELRCTIYLDRPDTCPHGFPIPEPYDAPADPATAGAPA